MIHLVGMGAMGAMTAFKLKEIGKDFTWEDNDSKFTAWKASTGAVFPTGEEGDMRCLNQYEEFSACFPDRVVSKNDWVYGAKKPPHKANFINAREVDHLKILSCPCYNVDVQLLVKSAREEFADKRKAYDGKSKRVISHGFSDRMTHCYWGWTRKVQLEMDQRLSTNSAFYFRHQRFFIRYAYPIGGSGWWYAGSTITKQKAPKSCPDRPAKEYERWKRDFLELTGGLVTVSKEAEYIEGWRPAIGGMHDQSEDQYKVLANPDNGDIVFPSRSHDGIRRFPDIWNQLSLWL